MSDLESVDLSQESDSDASLDISLSQKMQPPAPTPQPTGKAPVPQRSRVTGTKLTNTGSQNGSIAPEPAKTQLHVKAPPAKAVAASRSTTQAQRSVSQKPPEKAVEKPSEPRIEPTKSAPVKAKRGRPRKLKQQQKADDTAIPEPQPSSKPNPASKPATTAKPPTAAKSTTTPKATLPSKQPPAPKPGAKPAEGEAPAPRTTGRGRKRRLATKPVEPTQAEGAQENASAAGISTSQQPRIPEKGGSQKPAKLAKSAERKLHGAAKTAVEKRKRLDKDEEARGTTVPGSSKSARAKKKDSAGSTPEISEVPASPPPKGRPAKRARRQPQKEVARPVPQEVIRIEDDEAPPQPAAPVMSVKDAPTRPAHVRGGTSQETAPSVGAARPAPAGNAAPSRGRQSLPPSFARPAARRSKTRNAAFAASGIRQQDGPSHDLPTVGDAGSSPDQVRDLRVQTQNEIAQPTSVAGPGRAHGVRHSTGNIGAVDTDDLAEPDTREHLTNTSNDEAVRSMLDEIQRNALPFLLAQDRICDSFSARLGEDVDVILKDSDNDVFQVFSDRVKDALVADRLRLAIASAKADLRRGIEKHLREFARKVGAPLAEADSSLLLRNELRNHSRVKDDKKASRPFASPSPRVLKRVVQHRMAEESNHHEDASDGDDLSDDGDPILATPRQLSTKVDIGPIANAAGMRKFVGYSYDKLNLGCYKLAGILKLCAQPGGMTLQKLHELTPLGRTMLRNKTKDLIERGYLVEDIIRDGDKYTSVLSTAPHVSDT